MKRVLKDQKTGLYLRSMDEWTKDPVQAHSFRDIFQALKFCDEHHLGEIAVIGLCKDGSERMLAFRHAASNREPQRQMANPKSPTERIVL